MEWTDEGIVIAVRAYGETSAILQLITRDHGHHAGVVRGGKSRRLRGILQPGNKVRATWRARLSDHLGVFTVEPLTSRVAVLMTDAAAMDGLSAACAVAVSVLPEREPHTSVFDAFDMLVGSLEEKGVWPALFVRWELGLLQELGFGLDFSACAVTGQANDLTHVSPRSGRAVCAEAAKPYKDKLMPLPPFLLQSRTESISNEDIERGLRITGHFLERRVLAPHGGRLPPARDRLLDRLSAEAGRKAGRAEITIRRSESTLRVC